MSRIPRVRLTGRAARFLNILLHYGHIDHEMETRILLAASDLPGGREQLLDVYALRRVAAAMVFGDDGDALQEGILAEDWSLLFS